MSICSCVPKKPGSDQWNSWTQLEQQLLNDPEWSLLSLVDAAMTGSSLEVIQDSIPFRKHHCRRSMKCCGMCTRQCKTRCVQDSLHRLYTWRKIVESTPEELKDQLPLGVQLIVKQKFDTAEQLAWAVGEIISAVHNTELQQYMKQNNILHVDNPNKMDYSPQPAIDLQTGKRIVDPQTGEIKFRLWPESGLCPYCLPNNEVDRRAKGVHRPYGSKSNESDTEATIPWSSNMGF